MLRRLDLNSDMGERDNSEGLSLDAALMPFITSVNIACGGHAGNPDLMRRTAALAVEHGVAIGAHPGLPDRQTFGRAEREVNADEVLTLMSEQLMACASLLEAEGFRLKHVKPHGALYNMAARNEDIAEGIVAAVRKVDRSLLLFALAGSVLARRAEASGLRVVHEGFADRAYHGNGRLVPRSEAGAVLEQEAEVREQLRLLMNETVMTVERTVIPLSIQSLCLHSDTPQALALAVMIRQELERAGIEVVAASHVDR
ncbi:MAG TPA: 5-oxoprolinase subunit PxpA [Nitrospira sp.]|nr:5-oxoprolinase subunit PxpA [Nitrospira sp.]